MSWKMKNKVFGVWLYVLKDERQIVFKEWLYVLEDERQKKYLECDCVL